MDHIKLKILFVSLSVCMNFELAARFVAHRMVTTDTETFTGKEFSQVMTSDNGVVTLEYFIDRVPVPADDYAKELEAAYLTDLRLERQTKLERQKKRVDFLNQSYGQLLEKTLNKIIQDAQQILQNVKHPHLRLYLKFQDSGVRSEYHLSQIEKTLAEIRPKIASMVMDADITGLQSLLKVVEVLPEQLEVCFKNSVQNAIAQCDDTASLKELLTLVSV